MNGQRPEQRSPVIGCLKLTGIGCLVIFFMLIALGILLVVNRDSIRDSDLFRGAAEGFSDARTEMASLLEMSDRIRERYPAGEVNIGRESRSTEAGPSLRVTFEDPEFEIADGEKTAREIASFIKSTWREADYASIAVAFVRGSDAGAEAPFEGAYEFRSDELDAHEGTPPDPTIEEIEDAVRDEGDVVTPGEESESEAEM